MYQCVHMYQYIPYNPIKHLQIKIKETLKKNNETVKIRNIFYAKFYTQLHKTGNDVSFTKLQDCNREIHNLPTCYRAHHLTLVIISWCPSNGVQDSHPSWTQQSLGLNACKDIIMKFIK